MNIVPVRKFQDKTLVLAPSLLIAERIQESLGD